jgi:hypothetical protein
MPTVLKYDNLSFMEHSGPVQIYTGIPLPLPLLECFTFHGKLPEEKLRVFYVTKCMDVLKRRSFTHFRISHSLQAGSIDTTK